MSVTDMMQDVSQLLQTACTLAVARNHQMVMRRKNSMWKKHDLASKQQICKLQYSLTQQLITAVQFIAEACTSAACWSGHAFSVCCSCSSPSSCAAAMKCCFPCCGQMLHCLACNAQMVWTSLCAMDVMRLDHADITACRHQSMQHFGVHLCTAVFSIVGMSVCIL